MKLSLVAHAERRGVSPAASRESNTPILVRMVDSAPRPSARRGAAAWTLLGAGVLLSSAVVRVLAARGDLWLDEIWSLETAARASSALEVPWLRDSNSHPLMTLLLLWIGPGAPALAYRAPSVLAGVASVALAGAIGARRSCPEALCAMVLQASSYLMIHYSSEARGYIFAVCLMLACLLALEHRRQSRVAIWVGVFAACVTLGLLSHVEFIYAYGAMLLWSGGAAFRERAARPRWLRQILVWHALPLAAVFLYWVPYTWQLGVVTAPPLMLRHMLVWTTSLSVGLPGSGGVAYVGVALVVALFALGCTWLARCRSDRWILYTVGVLLLPGLSLEIVSPSFFWPRYVLVSVALFLMLLAELGAALFRWGRAGRVLAATLLVLFVAGNAAQTVPLLRDGRGNYRAALQFMASHSERPIIELASDHDFHAAMVFGYHARSLPEGHQFVYRRGAERPREGVDWVVLHEQAYPRKARPVIADQYGNRYQLERRYGSAPLSGVSYLLYRRSGDRAE